ncbi:Lrp/AsnC ligand binding domain-containing protein [Candidatus Bathyarchaeota archaeon]|nr:Lrp/AsnC ligand binding domain-containing protein [Candidatus Bathyarchaeota archaeon]
MNLVSACVLIRTERGRFEDVVKEVSQLKGVKNIFPVLGRYDVVVDVEAKDMKELGSIILRMGRFSGVVFTETLIEIEQ